MVNIWEYTKTWPHVTVETVDGKVYKGTIIEVIDKDELENGGIEDSIALDLDDSSKIIALYPSKIKTITETPREPKPKLEGLLTLSPEDRAYWEAELAKAEPYSPDMPWSELPDEVDMDRLDAMYAKMILEMDTNYQKKEN